MDIEKNIKDLKDAFTRKQAEPEAADKPLKEVLSEAIEEVKPKEEETEIKADDRSDYNCPDCKGEGLVWHEGAKRNELCPKCNGTGKLN